MMNRLFWMIAVILATAIMTWGLVAWADSGFATQSLWPMAGVLQLHPVHLIGVGLAILPPSLSALLLSDAQTGEPASTSASSPAKDPS